MEAKSWFSKQQLEKTVEALRLNGFSAYLALNREEAKSIVLSLIPEGNTVGIGGSVTIRELELIEELERRSFRVIHHWVQATPEVLDHLRREELTSDTFLCSVNAVTMDGKLISIDGVGNRVAAMIFGPKRVIVVAGKNKLVRDVKEGLWRAKNIAAVMHCKRLKLKTPCVKLDRCLDCSSPERACNITVIVERKPSLTDFHVILVNEDLGF
ncbi:MAG: lactate utilization protein [Thermofilaceae archaeon]